jgi:hypothetical protein
MAHVAARSRGYDTKRELHLTLDAGDLVRPFKPVMVGPMEFAYYLLTRQCTHA